MKKQVKVFLIMSILFFLILVPIFSLSIIKASSIMNEVSFEEVAFIESTGGDTFKSEVIDDLVVIIDMDGGLLIYNISNQVNPELLDSFSDGGMPHDFFIADELLYLADHYQGLEIYNISNPSNIVKIGQIADTGDGETDGVFVCENIAYTAEWHDSTWDLKLVLINVTDPTSPERISEYVDGDNEFIRFHVENGICYTACLSSGFKILNVTNPNSVVEIGTYLEGGYTYDLDILDNKAFIADGRFTILNLTDLSNPTLINRYDAGNTINSVEIQDTLAFISVDEIGVQAINISSLEKIEKLGEYETEDVIGLDVSTDFLYLSMHEFGFKIVKFMIIEITDSAFLPGISIVITVLSLTSLIALYIEKRKAVI